MKILLNEIVDEIYQIVKNTEVHGVFEKLERTIGSLSAKYSKHVVISALCWAFVTEFLRRESCEKKLKEAEEGRR